MTLYEKRVKIRYHARLAFRLIIDIMAKATYVHIRLAQSYSYFRSFSKGLYIVLYFNQEFSI